MKRLNTQIIILASTLVMIISILAFNLSVLALGSSQTPQAGSLGLEATIPSPPPTQAPTIALPTNGQSFNSLPITISGLCTNNLLVKVFSNNIFIGSTVCSNGSYSIQADLFIGLNDLYSQDYDTLDQGGPLSSTVSVKFTSTQLVYAASQVTINSNYFRLGVNPGQLLHWPITINGGTPPYAISTDWGDGQTATLQSSSLGGNLNIKHTYITAGMYKVTITATDSVGTTAFLQLVGIANGQIPKAIKIGSTIAPASSSPSIMPSIIVLVMIIIALGLAFVLGSSHGRAVLLRKFK